jgi:hypothetical protein
MMTMATPARVLVYLEQGSALNYQTIRRNDKHTSKRLDPFATSQPIQAILNFQGFKISLPFFVHCSSISFHNNLLYHSAIDLITHHIGCRQSIG